MNSDNLNAYRVRVAAQMADRREDVAWMAETGESLSGAAKRLGLKVSALEKWCEKNGLRDELLTMRRRDPRDLSPSASAKIAAEARWAS